MSKVVIAGGSGFIGSELAALLMRLGYAVVVLSRSGKAPEGATGVAWDGFSLGAWADEIDGAKAVINLTGSSIAVKWTKESKLEILQSRLRSTNVIAEAIQKAKSKPEVWINASAVGYYGDRGAEELTEESGPGARRDFVVDTCVAWEAAHDQAVVEGTRKTRMRIGIVLGKKGGALPQLTNLTRWFLGGHIGSGSQYMSWIHQKDLVRLFVHCMEHEMPATVNATSPNPSTNRFFMAVLRGVIGRPWAVPVPAFMLTVANWFGGPEPSLLLASQRAFPKAAQDAGFKFEFDDLRDAMQNQLG